MAEETRRGRWIPLVYYYLATLIGLTIMLVGLIGGLQGLVKAAIPQISDEVRFAQVERPIDRNGRQIDFDEEDEQRAKAKAIENARLSGFAAALEGLVTAAVGTPIFLWHLRQARRSEPIWFGTSTPKSDKELE